MRLQIASCLLCLMVVGASLDRLPDPPALKPQGNRNNLAFQIRHHVPATAKNHTSGCPTGAPHFRNGALSFDQLFESKGPSYEMIFVHHAADTSPPSFF